MGCGASKGGAAKYEAPKGAAAGSNANAVTDYLAKEDAKKEDVGQGFDREKFVKGRGGYKELHEAYSILEKLGEGSFGTVQLATSVASGENRAIKNVYKKKLVDVKRFADEIAIHRSLDHPNVVRLYEIYEDSRCMYLVMEYCKGGELFDAIVEAGSFNERQTASIFTQMLLAVNYLHEKQICHRDLKPENFLLKTNDKGVDDPENMVKLIDFGVSRKFDRDEKTKKTKEMRTRVCTPYYVAPEVVNGKYDEKCDLWSMGVILYILLSGSPPFYGNGDDEIIKNVQRGQFFLDEDPWPNVSGTAKDLINQLLVKDISKRLSAADALQHKWIKALDNQELVLISDQALQNLKKFRSRNKLKKAALTVIAGEVGGDKLMELKNTFITLDTDHSGVLSMDEIREGLVQAGIKDIPAELAKVMESIDADGSGMIDYTEFIAASMSVREYIQEDVCWKAFRVFDLDGNGFLTPDELTQVLSRDDGKEMADRFNHTPDEIEQIIKECDTDGDGHISFEEFLAMMKKDEALPTKRASILEKSTE
jgi:calcium-dependent protein kinase